MEPRKRNCQVNLVNLLEKEEITMLKGREDLEEGYEKSEQNETNIEFNKITDKIVTTEYRQMKSAMHITGVANKGNRNYVTKCIM